MKYDHAEERNRLITIYQQRYGLVDVQIFLPIFNLITQEIEVIAENDENMRTLLFNRDAIQEDLIKDLDISLIDKNLSTEMKITIENACKILKGIISKDIVAYKNNLTESENEKLDWVTYAQKVADILKEHLIDFRERELKNDQANKLSEVRPDIKSLVHSVGLFAHSDVNLKSPQAKKLVKLDKDKLLSHLKVHDRIIGESSGDGDCFFDSIAQGLDSLGISIPSSEDNKNVSGAKKLRLICHDYAKKLQILASQGEVNWIRKANEKDGQDHQQYLSNIQFTWGRPHIEGRIFCELLSIELHVIEVMHIEGQIRISHALIDKNGSSLINELEAVRSYSRKNTVHLVFFHDILHFVPLIESKPLLQEIGNAAASEFETSICATKVTSIAKSDPVESNVNFQGHTGPIHVLIVLRNGILASGSEDKTIKLWDQMGHCIKTFVGHRESIHALAELPDGTLVSGSEDNTIKLWNQTGYCTRTLKGHTDAITALIVLQDGTLVSGSLDSTIKFWDQEGLCIKTLKGHKDSIGTLAILPNGLLASGSHDNSIKLWDNTGRCIRTIKSHTQPVVAFAVLPNGMLVSGSFDKTIKIWDHIKNIVKTIKGHKNWITALTVLPNGIIVSGSWDKTIKFWNQEGHRLKTIEGDAGSVTALAVLLDGTLASASLDNTIKLWKTDSLQLETSHTKILKEVSQELPPLQATASNSVKPTIPAIDAHAITYEISPEYGASSFAHKSLTISPAPFSNYINTVSTLAVLRNGTLACGCKDATIKLWSKDGYYMQTLEGHLGEVKSLAVLPDGTMASGSSDNTIKLWDKVGLCIKTLEEHTNWVNALVVLSDGTLVSGSGDKTIKFWDKKGHCIKTLKGHTSYVTALAVLSDDILVSGSSDHTIKFWDKAGYCLKTLKGHTNWINALTVLSDSTLVSGSGDKTIKFWDKSGHCVKTLEGHTSYVTSLAVLPHDLLVSGSADDSIKIWNKAGHNIKTLQGHTDWINALAMLPDGTLISGSYDGIKIWNIRSLLLGEQSKEISTLHLSINDQTEDIKITDPAVTSVPLPIRSGPPLVVQISKLLDLAKTFPLSQQEQKELAEFDTYHRYFYEASLTDKARHELMRQIYRLNHLIIYKLAKRKTEKTSRAANSDPSLALNPTEEKNHSTAETETIITAEPSTILTINTSLTGKRLPQEYENKGDSGKTEMQLTDNPLKRHEWERSKLKQISSVIVNDEEVKSSAPTDLINPKM